MEILNKFPMISAYNFHPKKNIDECRMTTIIISLTECLNAMRPTLV